MIVLCSTAYLTTALYRLEVQWVNKCFLLQILHSPTHIQILPFDLESQLTLPVERNTWAFSNWSGIDRSPTLSCRPAYAQIIHDNATGMWTVAYYDLRHLSAHVSEKAVHRYIHSIPDHSVATSPTVGRLIWPFQGGYAGYFGWDSEGIQTHFFRR
jgi:hypothetical protein